MKIKFLPIIFLLMFLSPYTGEAKPIESPLRTVQSDIDGAMVYAAEIQSVVDMSASSYGQMYHETIISMDHSEMQEAVMLALMAKISGGNQTLVNGNYIGFYQIEAYGPFIPYTDIWDRYIDRRLELATPVKKNIKLGMLLADKIAEPIWDQTLITDAEMIIFARRFYCTPNHYSDIINTCDGGQAWATDWFNNYLPAAEYAWLYQ